MGAERFFDRAFDEGTLTKLQIYQRYTREWLPVFLSRPESPWKEIHLFDFFAGAGTDVNGAPGSPLLILHELRQLQGLPGWRRARVEAHFFDRDRQKIEQLRSNVAPHLADAPSVFAEIEPWEFDVAFPHCQKLLGNPAAAKLVFIDQFGVGCVDDATFRQLVAYPTCDFLFFISSATLHRFREHPAIRQQIRRPKDYYHVHRAVVDYYRTLLPGTSRYFLGGFSIRKGSNIYGIIFGSGHPLGMDKFLRVAWQADEMNGEADFDINRDDCGPLLSALLPTRKIAAFEADLTARIRAGALRNEADVIDVCFQHGVRRQHAASVVKAMKRDHIIDCDFRVPAIERLKDPRPIRLL